MNILDLFVNKNVSFRPRAMDELFALRLAHRLADVAAAGHYVRLLSEYSTERFLSAYKRALKSGQTSLAASFHRELRSGNGRHCSTEAIRLIAIKVERRSIGAAVYDGTQLKYTDVCHLSSSSARAQPSAIGFINWILANHDIQSAAMEIASNGQNLRRTMLTKAILEECILRRNLSLWPVAKHELLEGFGYLPLHSRKELREVILTIWPTLQDESGPEQLLDAAAIGAFVQTERLFLN